MNEHVAVIASLEFRMNFSRKQKNFPDLRQWHKHRLNILQLLLSHQKVFVSETKEQKTIKTAIIVKLQRRISHKLLDGRERGAIFVVVIIAI